MIIKPPRHKVFTLGVLVAVFILIITTNLLQADDSPTPSDAREKLFAMITGDISSSLAVENSTESPLSTLLSFSPANNGFPSGAVYGVGGNTWGQLGIGTAVDTNIPVLLSANTFGGPIATGMNHTLVTDSEGNLWAAGDDNGGQFGDGPTSSSTMTLFQTTDTDIKSAAAGSYHSLIVTGNGIVKAAGQGYSGQLGNGGVSKDTFEEINIPKAKKVVASYNNSFVITDESKLFVFGENSSGHLGVGSTIQQSTPIEILTRGVADVAVGFSHTLILMDDGSVMAAGLNSYGQFGDGTTDSSTIPIVTVDSGVKAVAAGNSFSLFLMADGSLQGVGSNSYGQLGFGDTMAHPTRQTIIQSGVSDIAAGGSHSLYVTSDGILKAMGNNDNGQLGLGDFSPRLSPETCITDPNLNDPAPVADVTANYNQTFFVKRELISIEIKGLTEVYSGANTTFPKATANFDCYAQWADGTVTQVTEKTFWSENSDNASVELNSGILDITDAIAGENIRITAGYLNKTTTRDVTVIKPPYGTTLYGFGDSSYSQLGLDTVVDMPNPMTITEDKVIAAAGGGTHSLYVREDGSVFSMGNNTYGQLGTGDTVPRTAPFNLSLTSPAIGVSAGFNHSLILLSDGSLQTMGLNSEGQLGDGTQFNQYTPTTIWNTGVVQADGGNGHSVFLTVDGEVWTMGRGIEGQLGNGSTLGSDYPYMASGNMEATAVAAGNNHTIFKTAFSEMYGMGDNSYGQLGLISSIINLLTPMVLVTGNVANIAAGNNHTMYSTVDKSLYLTGNNDYGQLGNGSSGVNVYGFTQLGGYTNVTDVYAGGYFSMFRDGTTLYGMGSNSDGQFGNGPFFTSYSTPINLPYIVAGQRLALGANHTLFFGKPVMGDLDNDFHNGLSDVIIGLRILTGEHAGQCDLGWANVDSDSPVNIGFPEVLFNLKKSSEPQ